MTSLGFHPRCSHERDARWVARTPESGVPFTGGPLRGPIAPEPPPMTGLRAPRPMAPGGSRTSAHRFEVRGKPSYDKIKHRDQSVPPSRFRHQTKRSTRSHSIGTSGVDLWNLGQERGLLGAALSLSLLEDEGSLERRRGDAAEDGTVSAHGGVDVQVSGCLNVELDHAVRATDVCCNNDVRITPFGVFDGGVFGPHVP